jgi:hypothetical protein
MLFTAEERQAKIDIMRQFPAELEALVNHLSEQELHTAYLDGEWTVAQNVHHVADSHMNAFIRVKLGLTEDHPTIKVYDQDAWAQTADARDLPIESSLLLIKGLHERWCVLWTSLEDANWSRPVMHPEEGEITVEHFLRLYADHGAAHIDQVSRTLAAGKRA